MHSPKESGNQTCGPGIAIKTKLLFRYLHSHMRQEGLAPLPYCWDKGSYYSTTPKKKQSCTTLGLVGFFVPLHYVYVFK